MQTSLLDAAEVIIGVGRAEPGMWNNLSYPVFFKKSMYLCYKMTFDFKVEIWEKTEMKEKIEITYHSTLRVNFHG